MKRESTLTLSPRPSAPTPSVKPAETATEQQSRPSGSFWLREQGPLPDTLQSLLKDPRFCRRMKGSGGFLGRDYYAIDCEALEMLVGK